MKQIKRNERRTAQIAIILTFLSCWTFDASISRGQTVGFAQSQRQAPPIVESESANVGGGFRSFVANLNPFKSDDEKAVQEAPATASSSRVAFIDGGSSPSRGYSEPATNAARGLNYATIERPAGRVAAPAPQSGRAAVAAQYGASRSLAAPPKSNLVSGLKKTSTDGVASLLLSELEEEIGDRPIAVSTTKNRKSPAIQRRSLRDEETLDALELIDDGRSDDEFVGQEIVSTESAALSTDLDDEYDELAEIEETKDEERAADDETESAKIVQKSSRAENEPAIPFSPANALPSAKIETEVDRRIDAKEKTSERRIASAPKIADLDARFDQILTSKNEPISLNSTATPIEKAAWAAADGAYSAESAPSSDLASAAKPVVSVGTPIVEIETTGPKNLIVGQESTYAIRVRNVGKVAARRLVVSTELPETVVASTATPNRGAATLEDAAEDSGSNAKRCVWEVGTLDANSQAELTLKLTPIKRSAFELVSVFDYERSAARAGVEVREPILEARIEGRDAVERGVEDQYRLRLRNVGNGDAENVELFVSTGENEATQRLGVLKAGEEKTLEIALQTVSEGSILLAFRAIGDYGVEASASKTVAILRGKLETTIEAPELQFVDGEFDAIVRARNVGDASLQDVVVVAQTPANVEILSLAGNARRNEEKRRVYWTVPLLRPGEEAVYRVQCRLTQEGEATFALVGSDRSGETTQSEATVQVASIAALAMRVKTPKAPVAVGKECVYELVVENNGTKEAQAIDSGVFLGAGLKPIAVEDGRGVVYAEESKVVFNQIERLPAGKSVVFRVRAKALAAGNHKVQAMLESLPEDARLLSEDTTYCYDRSGATRRDVEKTPSFVAQNPAEDGSTQPK